MGKHDRIIIHLVSTASWHTYGTKYHLVDDLWPWWNRIQAYWILQQAWTPVNSITTIQYLVMWSTVCSKVFTITVFFDVCVCVSWNCFVKWKCQFLCSTVNSDRSEHKNTNAGLVLNPKGLPSLWGRVCGHLSESQVLPKSSGETTQKSIASLNLTRYYYRLHQKLCCD